MADRTKGEERLLQESIEALRRIGFVEHIELVAPRRPGAAQQLRLKGACGTATFCVDVQPKLMESAVPALVHRRHNEPDQRILLVTSYVSPVLAEKLQQRSIEFLDASGNAYLDRPVCVFVSGKKRGGQTIHVHRAFRPAGLRLIYVLLKSPTFLARTQRQLATAAGIALGSVPMILQDLRGRGYIRTLGHGRQELVNARELLFRWEQGYGDLLRPKLLIRTCRLAGARVTINELLARLRQQPNVLLGGELGAAALTKHLRAETATLHIGKDEKAALSSLRLIPDPQGNISLVRTFGTQNAAEQGPEEPRLADPLLIHAELAQMTGDRIQEIGKMVLDQYVVPRIA